MTKETLVELGALSQDLKRVATFIARGSTDNSERFLRESVALGQKLQSRPLPHYLLKYIKRVSILPTISDQMALAEEALMIGCIVQNAVVAVASNIK